jgi:hypothetical protein
MRIYSNTTLSWPQTLHAFQAARIHPGRWHHYYFYKINHRQPLILTTYSPLEFLQENCQYYCYDKYYRDKRLEQYGNDFELVSITNKESDFAQESWVYVPKASEINDIIVIRDPKSISIPGASFKPSFNFPLPTPVLV